MPIYHETERSACFWEVSKGNEIVFSSFVQENHGNSVNTFVQEECDLTYEGLISTVMPGSLAAEMGITAGDRLLAVNETPIQDIIDLSFALADEYVELLVVKQNGEQAIYEIEKEYHEDLGIEFASAVFDGVRQCANRCIFCFVDQMPPGMRQTLYVKDDDYRLSFLYGNFITLTNLTSADEQRIRSLHLSPLYISVHATDGEIRSRMLNHRRGSNIMQQLRNFADQGIEFHTQVVLCSGYNDGEVLDKTIGDLFALAPAALSLAIVPVGLTRYREGCHPLRVFTPSEADQVIADVTGWQDRCRTATGNSFVYLADEFYLAAGHPIPEYDRYDDFPQLENGVGLVRSFLHEWHNQSMVAPGYEQGMRLDVVCGVSAAKVLSPLLDSLCIPGLNVRLVVVENRFFGPHVTVTGLLTGADILACLQEVPAERDGVIIPGVALRKGEAVFLDGMQPADIETALGVPVRTAYFARDLLEMLKEWR